MHIIENVCSVSSTNNHGHATFNFALLSGCEQLVAGATHTSENRLNLILTNVPGIIEVSVIPLVGFSDHSLLSCIVSTAAHIPIVSVSRHVFLKSRADWDGIRNDLKNINWNAIYKANCPITYFNEALTNIISSRIPSKVIKSKLKDKHEQTSSSNMIFVFKLVAINNQLIVFGHKSDLCWNNYKLAQDHANSVYDDAMRDYKTYLETLSNATQPHRLWSALKFSLFGSDSSIPAFCRTDDSVTLSPQEKADLLSSTLNLKQNDKILNLPIGCHSELILNSFAFRSSELKNLLIDLEKSAGFDPNILFLLVLIKIADSLALKLAVIFRILIRQDSFPVCWRTANVTALLKSSTLLQNPSEYRPIYITPILSKIFERLLVKRIFNFVNKLEVFTTNSVCI